MDLNGLGKFAKDVGKAFGAPAIAAWDLVTAPWNNNKEFNGFANTLTSTSTKFVSNLLAPAGDIASAVGKVATPVLTEVDKLNNQILNRPLTTAALALPQTLANPSMWGKAWEASDPSKPGHITISQAITGGAVAALAGKKDFDIYDPQKRDEMFNKNLFGKVLSGSTEAVADIGLDLTIGVGKVSKAFRASDYVTNAIRTADDVAEAAADIRIAASGSEVNKYTRVLSDFANNDAIYAYNHPMVKDASARGLLAHMLGSAKTPAEAAEVLTAGLGDPAAAESLMAHRADLGMALKRAQGEVDAFQARQAYSGPDTLFPWEDGDILAERKAELDAMQANYSYLNNMVSLAKSSEAGGLTRTTGSLGIVQKFDDVLATLPTTDFFQATPFHTAVHVIRYPFRETPAGLANLNDADSSREIIANVTQAMKIAGGRTGKFAKHVAVEDGKYVFVDADGAKHSYDVFTEERGAEFVDRYFAATTPEARSKVVLDLEEAVINSIAGRHGIETNAAKSFYAKYRYAKTTAVESMKQHGYATDLDGSSVVNPLFESQTANYLPIADFAGMDRALGRKGMPDTLRKIAISGENVIHYADVLNDVFKLGALMRFGYTVRNGVEAQLRITAATGAFGSLEFLGEGLKNFMSNSGYRSGRLIDRITGVAGPEAYAAAKKSFDDSSRAAKELSARVEKLGADESPRAIAERNVLQTMLDEHMAVIESHSKAMAKMEGKRIKGIGQGQINVVSRYRLADGSTAYTVDDALGGTLGEMWQRSVSVDGTYNQFINNNAHIVGSKMASDGYGAVTPDQAHYWTEWADTLNRTMRNSQVVRKFAEGKDAAQVKSWLLADDAGIELRNKIGLSAQGVDEYVAIAQKFAKDHMPNDEIKAAVLSNKTITAEFLRKTNPDVDALKAIHGNVIKDNLELLSQNKAGSLVGSIFRLIGSMPEDRWARNPLYVKLYREAITSRFNRFEDVYKRALTADEQWDVMKAAHADALKGVKSILFNVDRKTNAGAMLRMVAPFFSAYENSIKSWAKLAYNNPQYLNRAYLATTAPNRAGIATDADGNPVPVDKASMDDVMWFSVPKALQEHVPGLSSLSEIGITKRSLDVIFGGDFNLPFGPYVAIPVSQIVKDKPELEDSLSWALPFGPSGISNLLPTWARRQLAKIQGEDNSTYSNFFNLIYQTEMQKWRDAGAVKSKMPTMESIKQKTNQYYNLHSIANLVLPFAPKFNSPYRFYIDKYHEYQQQFGADASEKFYDAYPEFFGFTTSLSKNVSGINASVAAVNNAKKYSDLIGKIYSDEPKLIGLITNNTDGYTFSSAAYNWQQENAVTAGSSTRFREKNDPVKATQENNAQRGWIQYRKVMNILDAELAGRGLTSYQQKGAEDLADMKSQMTTAIGMKNTDWYRDYLDTDGSKTIRVVSGLKKIIADKKFMADNKSNPTWKSVVAYLSIRDTIQQELASRPEKSISAKANSDVSFMWDTLVTKLKNDDSGFKDLYDRFLSQDPVWDKVEAASNGL